MLLAPAAFAQGAGAGAGGRGQGVHGRGPGGPGMLGPRAVQALGLDDAQQQQLRALRVEMREDLAPVHEDLQELRGQMQQLWSAASPDRAAILALGTQMDALQGVIRDRQTELRIAVLEVLTAEQRAQLAALGEARRSRGHEGRRGAGAVDGGGDGQAEPGARGPRAGRGERGRRFGGGAAGPDGRQGLAGRLGLDESQRARVRSLREQMTQRLAPVREQMRGLHEQARAQWTSGHPDAAAIEAIHDRMEALQGTLRVARVDFRLALLEVLTPEQRAQLAESPRRGPHAGQGPRRGQGRRGQGAPVR